MVQHTPASLSARLAGGATVPAVLLRARPRRTAERERDQAKWGRILEEIHAAMADHAPKPWIDCPCCQCGYSPDEYRRHVTEAPSWCDRLTRPISCAQLDAGVGCAKAGWRLD